MGGTLWLGLPRAFSPGCRLQLIKTTRLWQRSNIRFAVSLKKRMVTSNYSNINVCRPKERLPDEYNVDFF
jgi:hypothetical protein